MKFSVLIVDDSSVMRKIIARSLRQAAGDRLEEVYEAGDVTEALEMLSQLSISMIFSDVNMPKMDGLEFVRRLSQSEHSNVPVVMVTWKAPKRPSWKPSPTGYRQVRRPPGRQLETAVDEALERIVVQPIRRPTSACPSGKLTSLISA